MTEFTIAVPVLYPKPEKLHWAKLARLKKDAETELWYSFVQTGILRAKPGERRSVRITRNHKGRAMDRDNLWATAKVPLDALVRVGLLSDDSPAYCDLSMFDAPGASLSETLITIGVAA